MSIEQGNFVGAIVTDCADDNAFGRQGVQFQRLFGVTPTMVGTSSFNGLEVGGNLVDLLDVMQNYPYAPPDQQGVLLGNAAPRGSSVKEKHENGTPFCYFWTGRILVATTFEEQSLALLRDCGITDSVNVVDIRQATSEAVGRSEMTAQHAEKITNSQFRSLEFLPLLAYWVIHGKEVSHVQTSLASLQSPSNRALKIDSFGNIKTTLTARDINYLEGEEFLLPSGEKAIRRERLKDVPDSEIALTTGSSGYGDKRFLELIVAKGSAAERLNVHVGDEILLPSHVVTPVNEVQ